MYKTVFSLIISLFAAVICVIAFGKADVKANAANDLSVSVEKLTSAEADGTQAGDLKVTVSIANNQGYAGIGFGLYYDSDNYAPVYNSYEEPAWTMGPAMYGLALVCEIDTDNSIFSIAGGTAANNRTSGNIISVYLRPLNGVSSTSPITAFIMDDLTNASKQHLSYTVSNQCAVSNVFRVGDANADGVIRIWDVQLVRQIIANANGVTVTEANFMNFITTTNVGDGVCFALMDADGNGVLTDEDATIITEYIAGYPVEEPMLEYCTVYYTISVS